MHVTGPEPDWARLFPDASHRWQMGLRPADAKTFFTTEEPGQTLISERRRWLETNPEAYMGMTEAGNRAVGEVLALADEWAGTRTAGLSGREQLLELGVRWEADFALMKPDEEGLFRLVAGVVCFPSSWALGDKLGRTMDEIHGLPPGLNAALGKQIHTFLGRLTPGAGWARENWGLSRDNELNHHPSRPRKCLDETVTVEEVWLRVERQLLLRVPGSDVVLFGIRVDVHPLTRVGSVPRAREGLRRALLSMSPEVQRYKGLEQVSGRIAEWLKE